MKNKRTRVRNAYQPKGVQFNFKKEIFSQPFHDWNKHLCEAYRENWAVPSTGYQLTERFNSSTYIDDRNNELARTSSGRVFSGELQSPGGAIGSFLRGKRHGRNLHVYDNGNKKTEMFWKRNKRDGLWTNWYKNGSILKTTQHVRGLMNGSYFLYYDNGSIETEGQHIDDKREGLWSNYYGNGNKWYEEQYENDKKHGSMTIWYNNGTKKVQGSWSEDNEDGLWTSWDELGQKTLEETYQNGDLISTVIY